MATPPPDGLEPLVSAGVVFRSRSRYWESLPHVATLVSSYLDGATPERWSIERACEKGFGLRMLKRLAAHEASQESTTDPFYRAYLAGKGLVAAIQRADDVDVVRWICCEYCPSVVPIRAMCEAARCDRLRVLQWLFEKHPCVCLDRFILDKVTEAGHLDVLQRILPRLELLGGRGPSRLLCYAARYGHLDIVRWLHEQYEQRGDACTLQESYFGRLALGNAIGNSHFEVAWYLVEHEYSLDSKQAGSIRSCARSGDLELIKWLHAEHLTEGAVGWLDVAAAAGHLDIVKWIHENIPVNVASVDAMDDAAMNGHLEVVEWLHANRSEGCSARAMDRAAENGHLDVVQWLHEHRSEGCSRDAMDGAAGVGSLVIVQWLHEHRSEGCTLAAMDGAAASGHLDVVQWLHENRTEGCTAVAMDYAAAGGHLETVQWLHTHRAEGCTSEAMDLAAERGHLAVVEWLHENRSEGCTVAAMDRTSSLEVLQWLNTHRTEGCSHLAMGNAVCYGDFEKVLFLRANNLDSCTDRVALDAIQRMHYEIFQWLRANHSEQVDTETIEWNYSVYTTDTSAWAMFHQFEAGRIEPASQ